MSALRTPQEGQKVRRSVVEIFPRDTNNYVGSSLAIRVFVKTEISMEIQLGVTRAALLIIEMIVVITGKRKKT